MNPSLTESKGVCQRCGEHFIFPSEHAGQIIDCPHCRQPTTLQTTTKQPLPINRRNVVPFFILAAIILVCASMYAVIEIKKSMDARRIADAQKAQIRAAEQQMMQPLAALKVKTEGCTIDELAQCETDIKTAYEINSPQLSALSDDIEKLIKMLDACHLVWKNSNLLYLEDGVIYPNWPGQLDAMAVIEPNITNIVNAPDYKPRTFSGKKFVKLALTEINMQSDIIMNEIRLQSMPQ